LFIGYIFFQLTITSPHFIRESKNEILRIEAYQISELLINDPGKPIDWPTKPVERFGLSSNVNKTNLLATDKVSAFHSNCNSDYENVSRLIDTEYHFSIDLIDKDSGQKLIECKPSIPIKKDITATVTRIVSLDSGKVGELTILLW